MGTIDALFTPFLRQALHWKSRRSLPVTQGTITCPGLQNSVEIRRDPWGVPHVEAPSEADLFFTQGFLHAQDRLWQMEINRRVGSGRLSELIGKVALPTDQAIRTFGFFRNGAQAWEMCPPHIQEIVRQYVSGVNAFIASRKSAWPIEFQLLKTEPEPWTPLDVLGFSQFMIWQLSHAWYGEVIRARVAEAVGPEAAAELEIELLKDNPLTLPRGIEFNHMDPEGNLKALAGPFLERGYGSNSWVVSGKRSEAGGALLSNDIHLSLTLPSTWYEMHLRSPQFHVTGVTIPGLPLVIVGHNDKVGWGITLAFTDCEDLFVERFESQDSLGYETPDGLMEARVIEEQIHVKGETLPHIEKIIVTRHGPIVSGLLGFTPSRMAVQSMALRPVPVLEGWWRLNNSSNWNEFVESMRVIEAPQLCVTYVDTANNIGFWVTGKVPIRKQGLGMVPSDGATGKGDWIGEVPFEKMPHALNPSSGILINCNQKVVPDDYPYFLGNSWMNGFRARRVHEVLSQKSKIGVEDCQQLQMDFYCAPGRLFLDAVREHVPLIGLEKEAWAALQAWDAQLTTDSIGGCIYEVFRLTLVRELFETTLGHELLCRIMGQGFHPQLQFGNEFHGHDTVTLLKLLNHPGSWWVRKAGGKKELLARGFSKSVEWLRSELGNTVAEWRWGKIHHVSFRHAFSSRKPLDRIFNLGPYPVGGDTDTPFQTSIAPEEPYACKAWAATYRQILDAGNWSRSMAIFPPGQSGQLGSPHYDDLLPLWLKGEYHPMLWTREEIERETKAKLVLRPV